MYPSGPYPTTRDFIRALGDAGELKRVAARVSPVEEIAAIADRVSKTPAPGRPSAAARRTDPRFWHLGGPALLFENVEGSDLPVLINSLGSYRRMEMALACEREGFEGLAARIAELVKPTPPRGLADLVAKLKLLAPLLRTPPRRRRGSGLCQEVVHAGDAADVTRLPLIRCWPRDGDFAALGYPPGVNDGIPGLGRGEEWDRNWRGRYVTFAGVHTIHADDRDDPRPASHNIGMYRVQLLGKRRMAMHWHVHHDGARHWRSWKALGGSRGEPMPVAIALGGEGVLAYAATAPLPPGISELLLAGFLNGRGIEMVRGKTVPLWVPANAEIVIEGWVSGEAGGIGWEPRRHRGTEASRHPAEELGPGAVFEGPFGDHTGFYSLPDRYPILDVTAITHRRDPVYPTTVVGLPPQEDYFLGKATERLFLPLLKTIVHDIEDYDLPMFGAFHNCACVQIEKAYPMQGRRVMHSVWGAGQMAWTKSIFVVEKGVDVHDTSAVLAAAAANCHPTRDVETVHGPLDILDHAAPRLGAGMKIGFDCTKKVAGEEVGGVEVATGETGETVRGEAVSGEEILRRVRGVACVLSATLAGDDGWLIARVRKRSPGDGVRAIEAIFEALTEAARPVFVIVVPEEAPDRDLDAMLFHWPAHCDASRDTVRRVTPGGVHRLGFDATRKMAGDERHGQPVRDWPPLQTVRPEMAETVRARWSEYGLGISDASASE
jgi:4-hydroxy-3-polyprenylbenzoate decarboxylase